VREEENIRVTLIYTGELIEEEEFYSLSGNAKIF